MKTFKELNIGDSLYFLDGGFDIRSVRIDGVRNTGLSDRQIELFQVGRRDPVKDGAGEIKTSFRTTGRQGETVTVTVFSSLDAAQQERKRLRDAFIDSQFRMSCLAFRLIKKVAPGDGRLKKRILDFFNINE